MNAHLVAGISPRPESEFEWEDLLVRVEVMPRALRVTLDALDRTDPAVDTALADLAAREARAAGILEAARDAAGVGLPSPHPDESLTRNLQPLVPQSDTVDSFIRLRLRNFAMVQRRGLEVWDWITEVEGAGALTVFQVLSALVRADVETLATLRETRPRGESAC